MNKTLRENTFESLEGEMAGLGAETAPERHARERKSRLKDDARSGRGAEPYRELNVKVPPAVKARLVALCRRRDMLVREFVLECLDMGFDKYGEGE